MVLHSHIPHKGSVCNKDSQLHVTVYLLFSDQTNMATEPMILVANIVRHLSVQLQQHIVSIREGSDGAAKSSGNDLAQHLMTPPLIASCGR